MINITFRVKVKVQGRGVIEIESETSTFLDNKLEDMESIIKIAESLRDIFLTE